MTTLTVPALELARALRLIAAAESAGLTPLHVDDAHSLAYLAEALGPVWNADLVVESVLKRGIPFIRPLQAALDKLVASGALEVTGFHYEEIKDVGWRLRASYSVSESNAQPVLTLLALFPDESRIGELYDELCLAVGGSSQVRRLVRGDALFADKTTSDGRLIELRPADRSNPSTLVANLFDEIAEGDRHFTPGEKVNLYIELLHQRAQQHAL